MFSLTGGITQIISEHLINLVLHVAAARNIAVLVSFVKMHVHGPIYGLIVFNSMKLGQTGCAEVILNKAMKDVNFVGQHVDAVIKLSEQQFKLITCNNQ